MTSYEFVPRQRHVGIDEMQPTLGQKEVAELALDSVALVFGAPATGKTSSLRFAYQSLVGRGLSHDEIAVFSATRIAANSLRDELALDSQDATSGPLAKTLTSFAFSLLAHQSSVSGKPRPELVSGSEQDFILSELIKEEIEALEAGQSSWPSTFTKQVMSLAGFRVELRDLVTSCLEHAIDAPGLEKLGRQHNRPDWIAAAPLLDRYLLRLSSGRP